MFLELHAKLIFFTISNFLRKPDLTTYYSSILELCQVKRPVACFEKPNLFIFSTWDIPFYLLGQEHLRLLGQPL
jgi:hypothetical protein